MLAIVATTSFIEIVGLEAIQHRRLNDGVCTDSTGQKGGGFATYRVCEAGTSTCSNEVTVSW